MRQEVLLRDRVRAHDDLHPTYFDPSVPARLNGLPALSAYYETLRVEVHIDRFELLAPKVEAALGIAVLSFNVVSYGATAVGDRVEPQVSEQRSMCLG